MSDDDDIPQLPADTLAILQEFLESKKIDETSEDWQLSQFWYDETTTGFLTSAVTSLSINDGKVALISCPTLMQSLMDKNVNITLFEFDNRFRKFGQNFVEYDYRHPVYISEKFHHQFDIVVADPPFLSEECLTKTLVTVKLLSKDEGSKIILCTGAVMEPLANKLAKLKVTTFIPKHKNNLANEFRCYTNFGELPS